MVHCNVPTCAKSRLGQIQPPGSDLALLRRTSTVSRIPDHLNAVAPTGSVVPRADTPLCASNLPTAEVNQRPRFIVPKAIEVAPRRMLPKGYVRSLRLGRVVVSVGDTLHAQVDKQSAHQRVFGFGRDASPFGLEISAKTIAPIAAD